MVGIAKNNLSFDVIHQLSQVYAFYGSECTNRHKDWSFYFSVVC